MIVKHTMADTFGTLKYTMSVANPLNSLMLISFRSSIETFLILCASYSEYYHIVCCCGPNLMVQFNIGLKPF